jgi:hypothetical protein
MAYFTARERSVLGKSIDERPTTRSRDVARDEFAPRRRATNGDTGSVVQRPTNADMGALVQRPIHTDIGSLVRQVSDGTVQKIDSLIAELQHRREEILGESMRVRHQIIAYAKLNQSTMDASRVISESLANLVKLSDAPTMNEMAEAVSEHEGATAHPGDSPALMEDSDERVPGAY